MPVKNKQGKNKSSNSAPVCSPNSGNGGNNGSPKNNRSCTHCCCGPMCLPNGGGGGNGRNNGFPENNGSPVMDEAQPKAFGEAVRKEFLKPIKNIEFLKPIKNREGLVEPVWKLAEAQQAPGSTEPASSPSVGTTEPDGGSGGNNGLPEGGGGGNGRNNGFPENNGSPVMDEAQPKAFGEAVRKEFLKPNEKAMKDLEGLVEQCRKWAEAQQAPGSTEPASPPPAGITEPDGGNGAS